MKFNTKNEFGHFNFSDSVISEIEYMEGTFNMWLDNVTISSDCSCNRDIRDMRANGFYFKIIDPKVNSFIEEGYKRYNADGVLMETVDDRELEVNEFGEMFKSFPYGVIYSIEQKDGSFVISIDANDRCYRVYVSGSSDEEEWDRFLQKEC